MTCSGFSLCHFHTMEYICNLLPYPSPPPTSTIPPPTHILSAQGILLCSNTMFLRDSHSHFQTVLSSFICREKTCQFSHRKKHAIALHKLYNSPGRTVEWVALNLNQFRFWYKINFC